MGILRWTNPCTVARNSARRFVLFANLVDPKKCTQRSATKLSFLQLLPTSSVMLLLGVEHQ